MISFVRRNFISILIAVGAFAAVTLLLSPGRHPLEGQPAPEALLQLLDGSERSLADHLGKDIVVLDFWATWCPPCRESLPEYDRIAEEYRDKNVVIYAVNVRESAEVVTAFLRQSPLDLPIALDMYGDLIHAFQVQAFPTTFYIDRAGAIRYVEVGYLPGSGAGIRQKIDALLAES